MTRIDGRVLALVTMMAGAPCALGCAPPDPNAGLLAPEETVAGAPEETAATTGPGANARAPHYYATRPPAAHVEPHGVAPGAGQFWAPGYHRWNGREHVWVPGGFYPRRDGRDYVSPHWENIYGRWEYIPGRWFRSG